MHPRLVHCRRVGGGHRRRVRGRQLLARLLGQLIEEPPVSVLRPQQRPPPGSRLGHRHPRDEEVSPPTRCLVRKQAEVKEWLRLYVSQVKTP